MATKRPIVLYSGVLKELQSNHICIINRIKTPVQGSRGVINRPWNGSSYTTSMNYLNPSTIGSAANFGDAYTVRYAGGALSNSIIGVWMGGGASDGSTVLSSNDYATIATTSSSTDYGYTLTNATWGNACVSDATRGVTINGYNSGGYVTAMEYITIATRSNPASFGTMDNPARQFHDGVADNSRGVINGGYYDGGGTYYMRYITIQTLSEHTSFGSTDNRSYGTQGESDSIRGIWTGGVNGYNGSTYITIQTTGAASSYATLTYYTRHHGCVSNGIRLVNCGGYYSYSYNIMDYFTIQTTNNAIDFGDLYGGVADGCTGISGD